MGKRELQSTLHNLCAWASALFLHNLCRPSGDSVVRGPAKGGRAQPGPRLFPGRSVLSGQTSELPGTMIKFQRLQTMGIMLKDRDKGPPSLPCLEGDGEAAPPLETC